MKKSAKKPARAYKNPDVLGRNRLTGRPVLKPANISAAKMRMWREAVRAVVAGK
jgi:hypothetical protein